MDSKETSLSYALDAVKAMIRSSMTRKSSTLNFGKISRNLLGANK